jgi:hypothetical protein
LLNGLFERPARVFSVVISRITHKRSNAIADPLRLRVNRGGLMLIRIRCRDKQRGKESINEGKGANSSSAINRKARYTEGKPEIRILQII